MRRHRGGRERDKEVEEKNRRLDEDNTLKSKMTQDRCLLLQPGKRLETHLLCK